MQTLPTTRNGGTAGNSAPARSSIEISSTLRIDPFITPFASVEGVTEYANGTPIDRDQEMQALREANATLTERLERMTEMMETRSEAPPPSYVTGPPDIS